MSHEEALKIMRIRTKQIFKIRKRQLKFMEQIMRLCNLLDEFVLMDGRSWTKKFSRNS